MSRSRFTNQQVIDAYKGTGSVWAAAKQLGLAGQTVHERLRALDYPLANRKWSDGELDELEHLVSHATITEIAHQLGRPYAGVACKISELGIGTRAGNNRPIKLPRGAGYDKASVTRYAKQIDAGGFTVSTFARANGLGVEMLCQALERTVPEWWERYRREHSDLPETDCGYCGRTFVPSSGKQQYCSRKCASDRRTDEAYFGGKRRQTIGLLEGQCQLCGRSQVKGLSSHHVFGKANDPDNESLIALCPGCHQIVTWLGGRPFVDRPEAWEALIQLAVLRRHGADVTVVGVEAFVQVDLLTEADLAQDAEGAA